MMLRLRSWEYPHLKTLQGKPLKGLSELRWKNRQGVPHRVGGYFAASDEFVMLIGFTHDAKKYDPPGALETIVVRKNQVRSKEGELSEFKILTDR
jgi:hypothetical protein